MGTGQCPKPADGRTGTAPGTPDGADGTGADRRGSLLTARCKVHRANGAALRRLHAQAQQRLQQLGALRFLYTGLRAELRPARAAFHSALCDALREEGLLLLGLQAQYEKVAAEFPEQAPLLSELCAQVGQNLRTVTAVLQRCL